MADVRGFKRLTAKRKFEVFLEVQKNPGKLGEVLRKFGLHVNDWKRIEATVESAAVDALKGRRNGKPNRSAEDEMEHQALVAELGEKDRALVELTVEYTALKKRDRLGLKDPLTGSTSRGRGARS